jgi:iron complex outermembrane recepter protein
VLRSSTTKFDDSPTPTVVVPSTVNNCSLGGIRRFLCGELPIPTDIRLNLSTLNRGGGRQVDQSRNYAKVFWSGDGYSVRSTTSFNEERFDYSLDGDGTPLRSLGGAFENRFKEEFKDTSQELVVESDSDKKLRWLAGLYYFNGNYRIWQVTAAPPTPNTNNALNRSAFFSLSYPLLSTLTASVDARFQRDNIKVTNISGVRTLGQDSSSKLPRVILDFKPTPNQTYYASAAKGNRPGSFNTTAGTPADSVAVQEQNLWSYEVGGRWSAVDNRTYLAATAFKIDWANQTTQRQIIGTTGTLIFVNANVGKTQISGVELEAGYKPNANWDFRATLAAVDAEYKDFNSDVCFNVTGVRNCAGQKLQNTPRRTASLLIGYDATLMAKWNWFARGDLAYRSDMPMSEVNTARNPAFNILNLRAGVRTSGITITAFVNNVTNENTPSFATRFLDLNTTPNQYGYQVALRRAREAGIRLRYDF